MRTFSLTLALGALVLATTIIAAQSVGRPAPLRWPPGAAIRVWTAAESAPERGGELVARAMATWTTVADGRFTLRAAGSPPEAGIRVSFVRDGGNYGEARPLADPATGLIERADVRIAADLPGDTLARQIMVYLTALHELGHALGLPHTANFSDIMYLFRRPDDAERYFGAFRMRLQSADDIGREAATGLSAYDVASLRALYDR